MPEKNPMHAAADSLPEGVPQNGVPQNDPVNNETRGPQAWLGVFGRGIAMGIAEVIPGVSGGTIAFISGIYEELLTSIARFGPASVGELFRAGVPAVWRSHNLTFLVVLAAGMGVALISVARLVSALLEQVPPIVWGFFFGLILASVWVIGRRLPWPTLALWGGVGCAIGVFLTRQAPLAVGVEPWMYFPGGMLAVTAWILPGVSGSLLLLMLGLYPGLLAAVGEFDLVVIGYTAAGAIAGLLLFTRTLEWLLLNYRAQVLGGLTGIMAGSLLRLWPWRSDSAVSASDGVARLLTPEAYANSGFEPYLLATFAAIAAGGVAVLALERLGESRDDE